MQAVILAAGLGTRMKEFTKDNTKVMLSVKNKPILAYKIENLPDEIDEVVMIVGYKKEQIIDYFGDNYKGRKIRYVVQEKLDGTGGAIRLVKDIVQDNFLVVCGDDLYGREDIKKIIKEKLAVLAYEVDDPERFGILKTDAEGNLVEIIEKPEKFVGRLANTGAYVFSKKIFDYDMPLTTKGEYYLTDALTGLAKDYPVKVVRAGIWQSIGKPEDLEKAEKIIEQQV